MMDVLINRLLTLRFVSRSAVMRSGKRYALISGILLGLVLGGVWYILSANRLYVMYNKIRVAASRSLDAYAYNMVIDGNKFVPVQDIVNACGVRMNDELLFADLWDIKHNLEQIPWISQVTVKRFLRGVISVSIQEREPAVVFREGQNLYLADRFGKIIVEDNERVFRGLVVVSGEESLLNLNELLFIIDSEPLLSRLVLEVSRIGKRRWDVLLNGDLLVRLPEHKPYYAWHKLAELQRSRAIVTDELSVIDMRVPGKVFLSRKQNKVS